MGHVRQSNAIRLAGFALAAIPCFSQSLALTGVVVYPSATAPALSQATVIIENGRITAVGKGLEIPGAVDTVKCSGCVVLAGFWNSHVHFTEPQWEGAADQPAELLNRQLEAMLTRFGFTTVVDTGSNPLSTTALRARIERKEVRGPRILTAGIPLYPPDGIPYYVRETVPQEILKALTPPAEAQEAAAAVDRNLSAGADLIKLFTGSWAARGKVVPMPTDLAKGAVEQAHGSGKAVFVHPSNLAGVRVAIDSGVDVLAHPPDDVTGVSAAILKEAADAGMAMIPTLKLFSDSRDIARIRGIVRQFQESGGRVLFGTDTGYLTDHDVQEEYRQLLAAGFGWRDVLAMLTESPAVEFREEGARGRVEPGMYADLTVLVADPAVDPLAFAKVRYTIRGGRIVWTSP